MAEATIRALDPWGMVALRGEMGALGQVLGAVLDCSAPDIRMSTRAGGIGVLWMAPDEVLVLCGFDDAPDLARRLEEASGEDFVSVAVVSDARRVFDIAGAGAEDVLSKLMPVDFAKLAETEVRRSRLAQVPAATWRHAGGLYLMCFRSVAVYAEDVLRNANTGTA